MQSMRWVPEVSRGTALHLGGRVLARMDGDARERGLTSLIDGAPRPLTVKRVGFVNPRVVVRPQGSMSDVAALEMDWTGEGAIRFADGDAFTLTRVTSSGDEFVVRDASRRVVMRVQREGALPTVQAHVAVEPELEVGRCVVLASLSWHQALSELDDPSAPVTLHDGVDRRRSPRHGF